MSSEKNMWNAESIKALRLRKGPTQAKFAHILKVSTQTVWRWEKGKSVPNPVYLDAMTNLDKEV